MKAFYSAAFAAGASAAVLARDQCCFQLHATGGQSGTVGQLSDGQNRIGGGHPAGTYCINNGAITDGQGRGCILTPPTTQFQCDVGATPTKGFAVGSDGQLNYNGDETFYACPADDSMYNIYTKPVANQPKCVEVKLNTGGKCIPAPPAPKGCPQDLNGPYQYPHLIVPVSSKNPNTAYGTQYNATINPDTCTIFNFDIPQSYSGKQCSLEFLFPKQSQLQTSSFTFNGKGGLEFYQLSSPANAQTTYANTPSKKEFGMISPQPGNSYTISNYACPAGKTPSIEVCSTGGLDLEYFQD